MRSAVARVSEEIVQDVALKIHARWSKIEKLEHRDAYVHRMITNEHLSWRRKWAASYRMPTP